MKMSQELLQAARDVCAFAKREGHDIGELQPTDIARVIAALSEYRTATAQGRKPWLRAGVS